MLQFSTFFSFWQDFWYVFKPTQLNCFKMILDLRNFDFWRLYWSLKVISSSNGTWTRFSKKNRIPSVWKIFAQNFQNYSTLVKLDSLRASMKQSGRNHFMKFRVNNFLNVYFQTHVVSTVYQRNIGIILHVRNSFRLIFWNVECSHRSKVTWI